MSDLLTLENLPRIAFVVFFFAFSIFIHEFGHMIAAIWRGLHVEKFSIGFGPRICGFKYKGIDFILSWLPLGGYVALPQMEPGHEGGIHDKDDNILPTVSALDKIIVAFAGPLFNVIFALFLSVVIWHYGKLIPAPVKEIAATSVIEKSAAGKAGLRDGDIIRRINSQSFSETENLHMLLMLNQQTRLEGIHADGTSFDISYKAPLNPAMEDLPDHGWKPRNIGPAKIELVFKDTPANKAGLMKGDIFKEIDGTKILSDLHVTQVLQGKSGNEVKVIVERDGQLVNLILTPKKNVHSKFGIAVNKNNEIEHIEPASPAFLSELQKGDVITAFQGKVPESSQELYTQLISNENKAVELEILRNGEKSIISIRPKIIERSVLGIYFSQNMVLGHPTPFDQFGRVVDGTIKTIKALIDKDSTIKAKHMSGFVGISNAIYKYTALGYMTALGFIVMVNISLAIFNLLPVPVLDGGHIILAIYEKIMRKPVPARILQPVMLLFMVFLLTFMVYVTGHDIRRAAKSELFYVHSIEYQQNNHA